MKDRKLNFQTILTIFISLVWLVNGLFCKVLDFVPRHQLIVSRILGEGFAATLTKAIGVFEILMFVWILTGIKSRFCTLAQVCIIMTMNILELIFAPDLLLFGRFNVVVAIAFTFVLLFNEFILTKKLEKNLV